MAFRLKNGPNVSKFMVFFGYFMVAVYIGLGVLLVATKKYEYIPKNIKFAFAFFFIVYGLYRLVKMLSKNEETD